MLDGGLACTNQRKRYSLRTSLFLTRKMGADRGSTTGRFRNRDGIYEEEVTDIFELPIKRNRRDTGQIWLEEENTPHTSHLEEIAKRFDIKLYAATVSFVSS